MHDFSACREGVTVVRGANIGTELTTVKVGVDTSTNALIVGGRGSSGRMVLVRTATSSTTVESYTGVCIGLNRTVGMAELTTTTIGSVKELSAGANGSGDIGFGAGGSAVLCAMDDKLCTGGNSLDSMVGAVGV